MPTVSQLVSKCSSSKKSSAQKTKCKSGTPGCKNIDCTKAANKNKKQCICTKCKKTKKNNCRWAQKTTGDGEHKRVDNTMYRQIEKGNASIKKYPDDHWWFTGDASIEVHHCIDCDAVTRGWKGIFDTYSYNINHRHNILVLPSLYENACQLHVQRHRGNHKKGRAFTGGSLGRLDDKAQFAELKQSESAHYKTLKEGNESNYKPIYKKEENFLAYPKAVKVLLRRVKDDIKSRKFCSKNQKPNTQDKLFQERMQKISQEILGYVRSFKWTTTRDGRDMRNGACGCSDARDMPTKVKNRGKMCSDKRKHRIKCNGQLIAKKTLQTGK